MLKRKPFPVAGVLVLSIVFLILITLIMAGRSTASSCTFMPRSLVGASQDEIEKQALDFICTRYETIGNAPQILLSRLITTREFSSLFSNGSTEVDCPDQQIALVIVRGNLKAKSGALPGYYNSADLPPIRYLALGFNLRAGIPTDIRSSPNGEGFGAALKDPTLPTIAPVPTLLSPSTQPIGIPPVQYANATPQCDSNTFAQPVIPPPTPTTLPATPTRPTYP